MKLPFVVRHQLRSRLPKKINPAHYRTEGRLDAPAALTYNPRRYARASRASFVRSKGKGDG